MKLTAVRKFFIDVPILLVLSKNLESRVTQPKITVLNSFYGKQVTVEWFCFSQNYIDLLRLRPWLELALVQTSRLVPSFRFQLTQWPS